MDRNKEKGQRIFRDFRQQERIDTQIHRRRKVKVFSPLESEWESSQAGPFPCRAINKVKEIRRLMSDHELQQVTNRTIHYPLSDHHT